MPQPQARALILNWHLQPYRRTRYFMHRGKDEDALLQFPSFYAATVLSWKSLSVQACISCCIIGTLDVPIRTVKFGASLLSPNSERTSDMLKALILQRLTHCCEYKLLSTPLPTIPQRVAWWGVFTDKLSTGPLIGFTAFLWYLSWSPLDLSNIQYAVARMALGTRAGVQFKKCSQLI